MLARLLLLLLAAASLAASEPYVSHRFKVPGEDLNPFTRELSVRVTLPGGKTLDVPAFYDGDHTFEVRLAPALAGDFVFGEISERGADGSLRSLTPVSASTARVTVATPSATPFVRLHPKDPRRFLFTHGKPYVPVGANLPWAPAGADRLGHYRDAFARFEAEGLNWTRIWMCHWGGLNLDWLENEGRPSPTPGRLDLEVARRWDALLVEAGRRGVYLQLVLQHHGQVATQVNPNWDANPWREGQPLGFLKTPTEFFSSEVARFLTRAKYRYIVARYGWSPSILAWELFNEVHNTDALRLDRREDLVAAWHTEMAAFLRSVDVHHHLVTTSAEPSHSPIYAAMDFLQPHTYPLDPIGALRLGEKEPEGWTGPHFHGEFGDDSMGLSAEQRRLGVALVPPVWASLTGDFTHPAQPWYSDRILANQRLGELGAVARFIKAVGLARRTGLTPFAPALEANAGEIEPLRVPASHWWLRRPNPDLAVPMDGSEPAALGDMPRVFVGSPESIADHFPHRATLRTAFDHPVRVTVRADDGGRKGARMEAFVDGRAVAAHAWPAVAADAPERPAEMSFELPPGPRALVLENTGGEDWFHLRHVEFDVPRPRLAAAGKRTGTFAFLWVWNRDGLYRVDEGPAARATLVIDALAAGTWSVTWWDTIRGAPARTETITHPGGVLRLPTPPVARHAAVVLERHGS